MNRRTLLTAAVAVPVLLSLGACASIGTLSAEVQTFGSWPANRTGGTYAFDRLPSQQGPEAAEAEAIEKAAIAALAAAGFKPVAAGQQPDLLVQLGAQDAGILRPAWEDPLWFRGGFAGSWRYGPWGGPRWGWGPGPGNVVYGRIDRVNRMVAVLLRDRASGQPLFEARASSEGLSGANATVREALFKAALDGFPQTSEKPRTVRIPLAS